MAARRDVAIYSPGSSVHFGGAGLVANEREEQRAAAEGVSVRHGANPSLAIRREQNRFLRRRLGPPRRWASQGWESGVARGGGAELQMALLSRGLAREGLRTALIVWPIRQRAALSDPAPDLVERAAYSGAGLAGKAAEAMQIWKAMSTSDASVYVFRGGGPQLAIGAVFCRIHRRKLVFSAAIDLDFDFSRPDRSRGHLISYRAALHQADLIVAQREQQAELAHAAGFGPIEVIPSFAEPADPSPQAPEGLLWIGRLVDYKRPLEFARLAESLPELPFRMVWFATDETPSELVSELRAAAGRIENLTLLGQLPRPQLLELIGRSTALVSTSRAEGMPNTFLEAWSRGVPVVSLDYDPDDQIARLGLGLVANSASALCDAVDSLARDSALRTVLGARAREHVHKLHSPEAVAQRWAKVLGELLRTSVP